MDRWKKYELKDIPPPPRRKIKLLKLKLIKLTKLKLTLAQLKLMTRKLKLKLMTR